MKINVGIDLGTTYSAVATFDKPSGRVKVLKNSLNSDCTPSVLCIQNGTVFIGEEAKDEQKGGNVNTVAFYKSMMGDVGWNAYIDGDEYSAEQLSALFLKGLVDDIKKTNGVDIDGAVITVPAYFNDKQREATLRAGKKAGLRVLKIINEPTSAIIAYGLTGGKDKNVMVYDLGGGTFDVTIAHVRGTRIDVLATNGNHQLGGKDWDEALISDIKDRFYAEHDILIEDHEEDLKELQVKCEDAKKRLTNMPSTVISIQCEGVLGKYVVTREDFEYKTAGLLNETISLINSCFAEITEAQGKQFGWSDIDEVVLVGGSTRMPQVKDMIVREYGKPPITKDINVDTIVASGAAMQAELCVNSTLTLTVASPQTAQSGGVAAPRGVATLTISNSDIQDITAHGLGMLALAGDEKSYVNSIIIKKNSKVNETFSREYTFAGDKLLVYVLQGESRNPYDTDIIGAYSITGMPANNKSKIKVNFLYNSNGVVEVNACLENGMILTATRETVSESMSELIARLEREKKEAEELTRKNSRIEIMLMIDTSGSMGGTPINEARKAAKEFIREFDLNSVYITIVCFAERTGDKCKWENNERKIMSAIDSIEISDKLGYGTSAKPINDYFNSFTIKGTRIMVVLTDGYWEHQDSEIRAADRAKSKGVIIYGIGIGDADEDFLRKISSGTGKKVDLSQLTATFKEVASTIATEFVGNSLK